MTEYPSEVVTGPSMMEEIEELLLNPMFRIPGESSTCNFPMRQPLADLPDPMAAKEENLPDPAVHHGSSQADMANITAHSSHSLSCNTPERDTKPTPLPSPAHSINLSDNVLHLQEEIKKALVHLLSARAATETHHQQIISEMEVSHCQNEIDTSEAIQEIKAQYATAIADAKATYGTAIRKVEAVCLASTSKV